MEDTGQVNISSNNSSQNQSNFNSESLRQHNAEMIQMNMEEGGNSNIEPSSQYVTMGNDGESVAQLSMVSSVITVDGISDWKGFCTVCYIVLLGDMSRGIMFPTLWPLVRFLGGTDVTQGFAVAAFSFGRILVSPLFGSWSVSYGYRYTLIVSCSVLLLGTLLYAQASYVGRPEYLIVSQMILGIGSGTLGVTRAYVAEISPTRNRTKYMAYLTALQYAGFTVTPFFGALFSYLFKDADEDGFETGIFVLNSYSAPAVTMTILTLIALIILVTKFENRGRYESGKKIRDPRQNEYASEMVCFGYLTLYDATILGCMLLNIATKGSIGAFETVGVRFAESHFNVLNSQAGVIVGITGTLGCFTLLSMGRLSKFVTDIQMIVFGLCTMGLGIISLSILSEDNTNAKWRYVFSIFLLYSVGYPIGHTAIMGLFSKIVGRRPQGLLLGWFASAGSFARITFPIMSGYITHLKNIEALFVVLTVILAIATIFTIRSKMVLEQLSG